MREKEKESGREAEAVEKIAEEVTYLERLNRLYKISKDPKVKKGVEALLRTGINVGITIPDLVPGGPGEVGSLAANGCKYLAAKFNIPMLDTTPDVSGWITGSAEAVDVMTGGPIPSHLAGTGLQLAKDKGRIVEGYEQAVRIWKGEQEKLAEPEVEEAMAIFSK